MNYSISSLLTLVDAYFSFSSSNFRLTDLMIDSENTKRIRRMMNVGKKKKYDLGARLRAYTC